MYFCISFEWFLALRHSQPDFIVIKDLSTNRSGIASIVFHRSIASETVFFLRHISQKLSLSKVFLRTSDHYPLVIPCCPAYSFCISQKTLELFAGILSCAKSWNKCSVNLFAKDGKSINKPWTSDYQSTTQKQHLLKTTQSTSRPIIFTRNHQPNCPPPQQLPLFSTKQPKTQQQSPYLKTGRLTNALLPNAGPRFRRTTMWWFAWATPTRGSIGLGIWGECPCSRRERLGGSELLGGLVGKLECWNSFWKDLRRPPRVLTLWLWVLGL